MTSMKMLVLQSEKYGAISEEPDVQAAARTMNHHRADDPVDANAAKIIKLLWADAGIQRTYEQRALFQLFDSAAFFLTKLMIFQKKTIFPPKRMYYDHVSEQQVLL